MKNKIVLVVTVIISVLSFIPAGALASTGVMDQSNGPGTSYSMIQSNEPCGQEFIPTMPTLLGVELYLYSSVVAAIDTTITITIRPVSMTGIPAATQSYVIPSNSPNPGDWKYFEFTTPLAVTPGNTYVLEVSSDTGYHLWNYTDNTYLEGDMIKHGDNDTTRDWSFRTWAIADTKSPPVEMDVDIDIKPGGNTNSINLKSKGVVPVALLTTPEFDATTIDPFTVEFAGAKPVKWSFKDVDGDGDIDTLFHFKTQELDLDSNNTQATLTGQTFNPSGIIGTDSVNIVNS